VKQNKQTTTGKRRVEETPAIVMDILNKRFFHKSVDIVLVT
jgi:hypothetical protein